MLDVGARCEMGGGGWRLQTDNLCVCVCVLTWKACLCSVPCSVHLGRGPGDTHTHTHSRQLIRRRVGALALRGCWPISPVSDGGGGELHQKCGAQLSAPPALLCHQNARGGEAGVRNKGGRTLSQISGDAEKAHRAAKWDINEINIVHYGEPRRGRLAGPTSTQSKSELISAAR